MLSECNGSLSGDKDNGMLHAEMSDSFDTTFNESSSPEAVVQVLDGDEDLDQDEFDEDSLSESLNEMDSMTVDISKGNLSTGKIACCAS